MCIRDSFIADRIQKFLREAGDAGDEAHCAVLYRTNSQSRLVEEALRRYNIRYTMVGGFSFYERAEIRDLLAYLRLVRNPHDSMAPVSYTHLTSSRRVSPSC